MTALLYLSTLFACSNKVFPTTTIQVDGKPVVVELTVNNKERARGLMHRESMPADDGMLFVYPDERQRSFWMKDTKLPLSIAFIDKKGTIVRIADMRPLDKASTKSMLPAKYALEMNRGWFEANDVVVGEKVTGIPTDLDVE